MKPRENEIVSVKIKNTDSKSKSDNVISLKGNLNGSDGEIWLPLSNNQPQKSTVNSSIFQPANKNTLGIAMPPEAKEIPNYSRVQNRHVYWSLQIKDQAQ